MSWVNSDEMDSQKDDKIISPNAVFLATYYRANTRGDATAYLPSFDAPAYLDPTTGHILCRFGGH